MSLIVKTRKSRRPAARKYGREAGRRVFYASLDSDAVATPELNLRRKLTPRQGQD